MILELINQTNIYASEMKGAQTIPGQIYAKLSKFGDSLREHIIISNLYDHTADYTKNLKAQMATTYVTFATSDEFSENFADAVTTALTTAVYSNVQINHENCYNDFIKPILDLCPTNEITHENLSNLLIELDVENISLLIKHPKILLDPHMSVTSLVGQMIKDHATTIAKDKLVELVSILPQGNINYLHNETSEEDWSDILENLEQNTNLTANDIAQIMTAPLDTDEEITDRKRPATGESGYASKRADNSDDDDSTTEPAVFIGGNDDSALLPEVTYYLGDHL